MGKNETKESISLILDGFEEIDHVCVFGSFLEEMAFMISMWPSSCAKSNCHIKCSSWLAKVARSLEQAVQGRFRCQDT